MNLFLSTWVLLAAGLLFTLPMIHLRVKDHTEIADEALCVGCPILLFNITILDIHHDHLLLLQSTDG